MSDPAMTAMARRPFPALLPTLGFIVFYFALQGLCTAIIIAAGVYVLRAEGVQAPKVKA